MPRPCKRRRICALPECGRFGPLHGAAPAAPVSMTVDEFECIRLIDLEGLTQEQCAARMTVARTTVQAIYTAARRKLAQCLVNARTLTIEGGDYVLCEEAGRRGCPHSCTGSYPEPTQNNHFKEDKIMKIAVTYDNGQVFQHFGHTEQFKVYDVADGKITGSTVVGTNGSGHGALAGFLKALGADTLICGGIGGGARQALADAGIVLYPGVSGNADEAAAALLAGNLLFNPNELCHHHDGEHGEGHHCGNHSCG